MGSSESKPAVSEGKPAVSEGKVKKSYLKVEKVLEYLRGPMSMELLISIYDALLYKVEKEGITKEEGMMILIETRKFFVHNWREFPFEKTKACVVVNMIRYQGYFVEVPTLVGWWVVPGWNKNLFMEYQRVLQEDPLFQKVKESRDSSPPWETAYPSLEEYAERRVPLHELFAIPTLRGFEGDN